MYSSFRRGCKLIRIGVMLQQDEREALIRLAQQERRDPREQAAVLIRRELQRCGFLEDSSDQTPSQATQND